VEVIKYADCISGIGQFKVLNIIYLSVNKKAFYTRVVLRSCSIHKCCFRLQATAWEEESQAVGYKI